MQDSGGARETCQGKLGNGMECGRRKEFCLDLCLRKISRAKVHDAFLYEVSVHVDLSVFQRPSLSSVANKFAESPLCFQSVKKYLQVRDYICMQTQVLVGSLHL